MCLCRYCMHLHASIKIKQRISQCVCILIAGIVCLHRSVKSHQAAILINLCIALLAADVLFVAGSDRVESPVRVYCVTYVQL